MKRNETKRVFRRGALLLLAVLLAVQPLAALAEAAAETNASESAVQYYAYTTVAQKIRKAPDKKSGGAGSLKAGETVYIIEIVDDDWVQIQFSRGTGYAQRQYLTEITPYDGSAIAEYTPEDSFSQGAKDFREAYVTYAYRSTGLHLEPDKKSRWIKTVLTYDKVIVSEVDGDWCYARFNNQYGYILCADLFMWDRLVPDAGIIPGLDIMPGERTELAVDGSNEGVHIRTLVPEKAGQIRGAEAAMLHHGCGGVVHGRQGVHVVGVPAAVFVAAFYAHRVRRPVIDLGNILVVAGGLDAAPHRLEKLRICGAEILHPARHQTAKPRFPAASVYGLQHHARLIE